MLPPRVVTLAASALLMLPLVWGAAAEAPQTTGPGEVRFLYLVPSDRSVSASYSERIAYAARHFQSWLGRALDGRTFRLASPIVRVVRSDKPAKWFSSAERYNGYNAFYRNTLEELTHLGLVRLNDPQARYVVYVDADHACGQSGAGGSGLAVVSANDLRGLSGERIVPACQTANGAEIEGRCRWIGGMGHELLHTLGLMHPDRSPACQTNQCRASALMMQGYIVYPKAILLDEEKIALGQSLFVQARPTNAFVDCAGP